MTEIWIVPVLMRVFCVHLIYPWFLKSKIIHTDRISFVNRFLLHYFFAAILGVVTALWLSQLSFDKTTTIILGIGAANGYAAYCQWKTDQINQSLAAIYRFVDDVIAMTLGYWVLNEIQHISMNMIIGLAICSIAVISLPVVNYFKRGDRSTAIPVRFFGYILIQTVIWGFAKFLMKYFAINSVPIGTWVFGWYGGAFLMAVIIFCVTRLRTNSSEKKDEVNKETEPVSALQTTWMSAVAGTFVFAGVFLGYWALSIAPLTVVNPIFFAASIVGPAVIGLFLFDESKKYIRLEKFLIFAAIFGAIFFALSFMRLI